LLQSALANPRQLQAYGKNPDVIELAAAYTVGILHNHPFIDGDKRIGLRPRSALSRNERIPSAASEEDATQAVLGLAEGTLDEAALVAWLRADSHRDPRKKRRLT
jgi:death-on-curing protein